MRSPTYGRSPDSAGVFALCEFPDHTSLDRALSGLPIVVALGSNAKTQAWPVYPYEEYADQLREAVEGS